MRIAIFIYGLTGGGATRRTLTLAEGFSRRGHSVDMVVISGKGPLVSELPSSVQLVELATTFSAGILCRRGSRRRKIFFSQFALACYLRKNRPDVLLAAANHVNLAAIGARKLSGTKIPLITRVSNHLSTSLLQGHQLAKKVRYYLACRLYRQADAIITVAEGIADDIKSSAEIPSHRVTTIYNPTFTLDLVDKAAASLQHPWFVPGAPPVIIGVGRLTEQKDFITLVKAFSLLRKKRKARLVILGEGKDRNKISSLIEDLGLVDDVEMPGYVDNPIAWMANASVFCLSSIWEGLPGVLIEAMAAGCPVVSTDCPGGASEILENGKYGPLVHPGDDKALAAAISTVLDAPIDREVLKLRAADFSVENAINGYLEVLKKVTLVNTKCFPDTNSK